MKKRAAVSVAQDGLFDKAYDLMHAEPEVAAPVVELKNKPVKLTVRLFQPLKAGSDVVAELPAYRKEWRFRGPQSDGYVASLKQMQRRVGTTIVVLENDVVREHHTLGPMGWESIEEKSES